MIVTCESCQSKYKLDDSKITGRGARITCPSCKHVFVVYKQAAAPPPPAAPAPAPAAAASAFGSAWSNPAPPPRAPAPPPPAEPAWDEEEPTRIGMASVPKPAYLPGGGRSPAMANARPASVPPTPPAAPPANGSAYEVRRSHPTLALPVAEDGPTVHAPPPPPTSAVTVSPAEAAARAATLDFRQVGVAMWKAKVKIGLVYDFPDIKTLRKYIQDGRVTSEDQISHDGREWKKISEIPDLDVFFVDTFERLQRARATAPPEPGPSPRVPTPAATDGERKAVTDSQLFRDPFEELKSKQRERVAAKRGTGQGPAAGKAAAEKSGAGRQVLLVGLLLVAVAAVAGAAWWYYGRTPVPVASTAPTPRVTSPAASAEAEKTREEIRRKLEDRLSSAPEATPPPELPPSNPNAILGPDGQELIPIGPPGSRVPTGATPVIPKDAGATTTAASPIAKSTGTPINQTDARASDHEQIGDASARSGDWAGAVRAYSNAVSLDPNNGKLLYKLGNAQYKSGDLDGAASTLRKAASAGQRDAYKLLGAIAEQQGDVAGAMSAYQQYVATNPRDAAEIEAKIKQLSGA